MIFILNTLRALFFDKQNEKLLTNLETIQPEATGLIKIKPTEL